MFLIESSLLHKKGWGVEEEIGTDFDGDCGVTGVVSTKVSLVLEGSSCASCVDNDRSFDVEHVVLSCSTIVVALDDEILVSAEYTLELSWWRRTGIYGGFYSLVYENVSRG